jgi:hypothetical protein
MNHYQGESLEFRLELKPIVTDNSQIDDFSQLANVTLYFYTDNHVSKFSMAHKEGYNDMELTEGKILTGVIPSNDSKLMCGALKVDILCVTEGEMSENIIEAGRLTGIAILKSKIKNELT